VIDPDPVAGLVRDQAIVRSQPAPQVTHAHSKSRLGIGWQLVTPQGIDQLRPCRRLRR
jgi:hypothetical protein